MVEYLNIVFTVSGVEGNLLLLPMLAMGIAFFASLGGLSGAFLLLPFMISVLGYAGPSASATNFVYNIAAIPAGVYRFSKEKRVLWPLVWVFIAGTLPGLVGGYYLRIKVFPDPQRFKLLVGAVLMYMAIRLFIELMGSSSKKPKASAAPVKILKATRRKISFAAGESEYTFKVVPLFMLSLAVGVIGGAYGIGGGAIIVPYLVAVAGLPVYAVAGASLLGTFITSIAGVGFYMFMPSPEGIVTAPDWALGLLFGLGGAIGIYLGARAQRHVPERLIRVILFIIIFAIAVKYLWGITEFIS